MVRHATTHTYFPRPRDLPSLNCERRTADPNLRVRCCRCDRPSLSDSSTTAVCSKLRVHEGLHLLLEAFVVTAVQVWLFGFHDYRYTQHSYCFREQRSGRTSAAGQTMYGSRRDSSGDAPGVGSGGGRTSAPKVCPTLIQDSSSWLSCYQVLIKDTRDPTSVR